MVGAICAAVLAACGPPPSTPGPVEPTQPPVAPRLLLEPVGASGMAAISQVTGTWTDDGFYVSTATAHRKLDEGDTEDRALVFAAMGQLNPLTGQVARTIDGPAPLVLGMCDSAAVDSPCTPLRELDDYVDGRYSPDGSKLALVKWASASDPVHRLRVIDSTTYETIVEVADDRLVPGRLGATWSPDSSQLAIGLDGGLAVLAAAPGAQPVVLVAEDIEYPPPTRQIVGVIGWTDEGRIISGWQGYDESTFPTPKVWIESMALDGSSLRDLGDPGLISWPVIAPNGSLMLGLPSGPTGQGSVPAALSDADGAVVRPLATAWVLDDDDGHREADVAVLGFTSASAL